MMGLTAFSAPGSIMRIAKIDDPHVLCECGGGSAEFDLVLLVNEIGCSDQRQICRACAVAETDIFFAANVNLPIMGIDEFSLHMSE